MRIFIFIFVLLSFNNLFAQSYSYSYVDPCTGKIKSLTIPGGNNPITVNYYGTVSQFNGNDFNNGNFLAWINSVAAANSSKPCGEVVTTLTTNVNMLVTQNIVSTVMNVTSIASMAQSMSSMSSGMSEGLGNSVNNSENGGDNSGSKKDKKDGKNNGGSSGNSSLPNNNSNSGGNTNNTSGNQTQGQGSQINSNNGNSTQQPGSNGNTSGNGNTVNGNGNNPGSSNGNGQENAGGSNGSGSNGNVTNGSGGSSSNNNNGASPNNNTTGSQGSGSQTSGQTSGSNNQPSSGSGSTSGQTNTSGNNSSSSGSGTSTNGSNSSSNTQGGSTGSGSNTSGSGSNGGGSGTGNNGTNGTGGNSTTPGAQENTGTAKSGNGSTGGISNSISNSEDNSGGKGSGSKPGGSKTRTGSMIGSGDVVALKSAEDPGAKNQFKFTASLTHANTNSTKVSGLLGNYTTEIRNLNLTLYKAWVIPESQWTIIVANSSMINYEKDFFNTTTSLASKRFKGNWKKLTLMGGLNYTAGNLGETRFNNLSAVGGGFYSYNFSKKVSGSILFLAVYSPFTQFFEGQWWESGTLIVPFSSWDYSITKTFKFNISFSGVYEVNSNFLNYQVLTGGKILF